MSSERHARVSDLFLKASELSPEQRRAFLDEACAGDSQLRDEVESLLVHDDDTSESLADEVSGMARSLLGDPGSPAGPARIGPYRILRRIGTGGMGDVYQAEQDNPRRTVALKVLRSDVFSVDVLRRFQLEVQLLGQLKHPAIAQIYEAGTADTGRGEQPYFAMEYVQGRRVLDYVRQVRLGTRERLELFAKICDGVHYAHQKGVIHRDLKPANILVDESVEGGAQPKILDFGVARASDSDLQVVTMHTAVGQIVGTLSYMSPEQIAARPEDLDTRSDVYALGVILYELMAGRLPYELEGRSIPEAGRVIRTHEPPGLGSLDTLYRGDVETIASKALEKDRERRYPSAAELAADVRRHLNDEAIVARPPSIGYRLGKFAKRNKGLAAGLAGAVAALVLGTAVSTTLYFLASARAEALRRAVYLNKISLAQNAYDNENTLDLVQLLDECPVDLRGWEWRYLHRLSDTSLVTLRGHDDTVWALAVSPDGAVLASGSQDKTIRLWDLATREPLRTVSGYDGWHASVAFSPDGTRVIGGAGERGSANIWDAATGEIVRVLTGHTDLISTAAFSPDGRTIATGSFDATIKLWDARSGRELRTIRGHDSPISSLDWSPDGRRIVSGSWDDTVRLWDVPTGGQLASLAHDDRVTSVAFRSDGRTIASGSWDYTVKLWDATAGAPVRTIPAAQMVHDVAFSPDGRRIAGASGAVVKVWDVATGEQLGQHVGHLHIVRSVVFSPDGAGLLSAGNDRTIRFWPVVPLEGPSAVIVQSEQIRGVAVSPDGRWIVSGGRDGTIRQWDVGSRRERLRVSTPEDWIEAVAISADGRRIASTGVRETPEGRRGPTRLWDASTGELIRELGDHDDRAVSVTFSPDDRLVASAGLDGTVKVWEVDTGRLVRDLFAEGSAVDDVSFSADGRSVISAGDDDVVRIWDIGSGREVRRWAGVSAVAVSGDGRWIAYGGADLTVRLSDAATGEPVHVMAGHHAGVLSVAFSPDNTRLVSGGLDNLVKVWHVQTGKPVLTLRGHRAAVYRVAFDPEGDWLVSASADRTLRIWEAGRTP